MNEAARSSVRPRPLARRANGRFAVPRVPAGVVARPALEQRREDGVARGMVLVTGPAGSGKTLLLASWAADRRSAPAWLAVEPEDGEPERFWARALAALQARYGAGGDGLAELQSPPVFDPRFVPVLVDACQ
ncbi:MAG: hypothetical protein ACTHOK_06570, partial [Nocardioidaceae bacterium]